jgi:hypothetical protein
MTTPDIAAAMQASMDAENRRRELAGQSPGLGVFLSLPQPPAGPGVGLSDVALPVIGEGYDQEAPAALQHKAYGETRPVYAAGEVGGLGYPLGIAQPARRHVTNLGADGLLIEPGPDGRAAGDSTVFVSPQTAPKPSLWSRLKAKLGRS